MPGERGVRRDEGGAIVLADVIGPVEQRMDEETEVDPMGFLNTNAYGCDIDMMIQPYDKSGYQHGNEDMDDMPGQEGHWKDCKKSLFMNSLQDTPKDVASTHDQLAGARTVISPRTRGRVKEGSGRCAQEKGEEEIGENNCLQTSQSTKQPDNAF